MNIQSESKKEKDLFDTCFGLVSMGKYKSNIPHLKDSLDELRTMMVQKTAGQRANKPKDVSFYDLPRIKTNIIIESLCLYLSGDLENIETLQTELNQLKAQKMGVWLLNRTNLFDETDKYFKCSICGLEIRVIKIEEGYIIGEHIKFCYGCGARMKGECI